MEIGNVTKKHFKIVVAYGLGGDQLAEVDDIFQNSVIVYSCPQLASTCGRCLALNKAHYSCCWGGTNQCVHSGKRCGSPCPAPDITKIIPNNGPTKGGTHLSIYGTYLGKSVSEVEAITVAGVPCDLITDTDLFQMQHGLDLETSVLFWLVCITRKAAEEVTGAVNVVVDGQSSETNLEFSYKTPSVTSMYPTFGPKAGGTTVTLYGNNLGVGNKNVSVLFGNQPCQQSKVYPEEVTDAFNHTVQCIIECTLPGACTSNITELSLSIDAREVVRSNKLWYSFSSDPIVNKISPKTAFFSGGTILTVDGKHLSNAHSSFIKLSYKEEHRVEKCDIVSAEQGLCKLPEAPQNLKDEFKNYFPSDRTKTNACYTSIGVTLELNFDAVCQNVTIAYFQDPIIHDLPGDGNIITFDPKAPWVEVTVECLNVVPADSNITITVGTETCTIINVTTTSMVCIAPATKPRTVKSGVNHPRVNVTIGDIHKTVGYLRYDDDNEIFIVVYVLSGALFVSIAFTVSFISCRRYRKTKNRVTYLERRKTEIELRHTTTESRQITAVSDNSTYRQTGTYTEINDAEILDFTRQAGDGEYNKENYYLVPLPYVELYTGNATKQIIAKEATPNVSEVTVRNSLNSGPTYLHPVYDFSKTEGELLQSGTGPTNTEEETNKHH